MDQLSFADVLLFTRVALLGSLSAVARERNVPVSQVSRALSRIEKACGARLIHRSTHGLALSAEGETFLAYCQRLAGTLDEMEGEFASTPAEVSGLVRVAASTVVAQYQLLPSLASLHQRHPRLRVELKVSDRLADMAREGIDIAIRSTEAPPESMVARQIGQLGRALYAAPAYLAAAGTPGRIDELCRHRLITNSGAPQLNRWPFMVDGQLQHWHADGDWRCNDTAMAAAMVLQGLGIGRLATLMAEPLVRQGQLVAVLPDLVALQPVPVYAVMADARQRLPKVKACVDHWADWLSAAQRA